MAAKICLKLFFLKSRSVSDVDVIRRVQFDSVPTWSQFLNLLQSYYPETNYSFTVKWIDSDGDEITIGSQAELQEASASMVDSPFKLYISKELSSNAVPQPICQEQEEQKEEFPQNFEQVELVPEFFYSSSPSESSVEEKRRLQETIPEVITSFMVNGVLPPWTSDAIRIYRGPNSEVLFDVDIPKFNHNLHRRALDLLTASHANDEEAARLLQYCILLSPNDSIAFYNLACALSRLHRTDEALTALQNAVRLTGEGEGHLENIKNDDDLEYLRQTDEFKRAFPQISPPIPSHFLAGLEQLHAFGLMDDEVNLVLLEQYNGDASAILQDQLRSCLF